MIIAFIVGVLIFLIITPISIAIGLYIYNDKDLLYVISRIYIYILIVLTLISIITFINKTWRL
ncbi:hypothetical protein C6499_04695 [Candidatus Poribacteria bacterium]|nr:MAG: hypothetical protein C6499_04695 [Candidatus Poribacteria bacterium]